MSRRLAGALGAVIAAGACVALAAISRAPLTAYPDSTPVVRLAWSVRPERIESCRTLTDAELADVPAHMRQRVQCEGRAADYRLLVSVDGEVRIDTVVTGGGARSDRPVYVLRELAVQPGNRTLAVRFEREPLPGDSAGAGEPDDEAAERDTLLAARAARETQERNRRRGEAVPPVMALTDSIRAQPREVILVTYDVDRRTLVRRTRAARP